jgi:hypothetical protein
MGVIKGVLKEELENSIQMKKDYERELAKLGKGTLIKKTIKGHEYYYVLLREKGKVRFIYKGKKVSEDEVARYSEAKKYRAKYKKLLSQVKKQIVFLRRSLRGKEEV